MLIILPAGAAFAWREDGYVQAVDTLLLYRPPQVVGGTLANVVCWLALRLGYSTNTQDMLELFCPFLDGYAMNVSWPVGNEVNAVRYEFAGNYMKKSCLSQHTNQALRRIQTNHSTPQTKDFFNLLTSRTGRNWAYANKDVKAYFLYQVKPDKLEVWLGSGPAARHDAPLKIIHAI